MFQRRDRAAGLLPASQQKNRERRYSGSSQEAGKPAPWHMDLALRWLLNQCTRFIVAMFPSAPVTPTLRTLWRFDSNCRVRILRGTLVLLVVAILALALFVAGAMWRGTVTPGQNSCLRFSHEVEPERLRLLTSCT